jgi:NADH-quinone oxidoreductase subunit H
VLFFVPDPDRDEAGSAEAATDQVGIGFPVPPMPAGGAVRGAAAPITFAGAIQPAGEEI